MGVKTLQLFLLFGLMALSMSCESRNQTAQYGNRLIKTYKDTQKFGDRTSVQSLQESIRAFQASNGRYPNDLKELEDFAGIPLDRSKYAYDPLTGIISPQE